MAAAHNTYYLDTYLRIGEKALINFNERIEASLYMSNEKFSEKQFGDDAHNYTGAYSE